MDLSLSGKNLVVVGAARGIGRAIAEAFAAEGASPELLDLDPHIHQVAEEISETHRVAVLARSMDVTDEAEMNAIAREFTGKTGPPSHVIYCAGIGSGKFGFPFTRLDPGDWRRVFEVNLMGFVHTAHAFAPRLIEAAETDPTHGATLQVIVSVAGQIGSQTDPPYSAAKAAQINFMQCLAKDLAPHGVRVNALSPGMVRTALNRSVWAAGQETLPVSERQDYETWAEQKIRAISPLGRWQEAAEFGAAAVFLASPHARNLTGQVINIDGGQVMHS